MPCVEGPFGGRSRVRLGQVRLGQVRLGSGLSSDPNTPPDMMTCHGVAKLIPAR